MSDIERINPWDYFQDKGGGSRLGKGCCVDRAATHHKPDNSPGKRHKDGVQNTGNQGSTTHASGNGFHQGLGCWEHMCAVCKAVFRPRKIQLLLSSSCSRTVLRISAGLMTC